MRLTKNILILFNVIFISTAAQADFSAGSSPNLNYSNPRAGVNTGATASAERVMKLSDHTKLDKLVFDFGNAQAWLKPQGDWHINGWVKHSRVRCATYQLGVRFGIGERGCTNVSWMTDFEYGTNVKQCNSATLKHVGGGFSDRVVGSIEEITCAEVKVRCFGKTCK